MTAGRKVRRVRIWRNFGWCAVCPCCDHSITWGRRTWREALTRALRHIDVYHTRW